jgi:hypothetical protein
MAKHRQPGRMQRDAERREKTLKAVAGVTLPSRLGFSRPLRPYGLCSTVSVLEPGPKRGRSWRPCMAIYRPF